MCLWKYEIWYCLIKSVHPLILQLSFFPPSIVAGLKHEPVDWARWMLIFTVFWHFQKKKQKKKH